jgi:hypothetical protein
MIHPVYPPPRHRRRPRPDSLPSDQLIISGGFVMVLPLSANGPTQPASLILGDQTALFQQMGLCVFGVEGDVFATTGEYGSPGDVVMFPSGATGNTPPGFTLQGPATQLLNPWGVLMLQMPDFSPGPNLRLWVANTPNQGGPGAYITSYPAAGGDQTPISTIAGGSTQLNSPKNLSVGVALVEGSFATLYVTQGVPPWVLAFPVEATGDVAPVRFLGGDQTGLTDVWGKAAFDNNGKMYVCNRGTNPAVLVFASGASGNVAPVGVLSGTLTQLQELHDIDVSSAGEIYVLTRNPQTSWVTVLVFAAGATGNVAPVRVIEPPIQGFNVYSMCIYEEPVT